MKTLTKLLLLALCIGYLTFVFLSHSARKNNKETSWH